MSMPLRVPALLALALSLAAPAAPAPREAKLPPSTRLLLDNGFEAILIPNRAASLVASVVVVRTGVNHETPELNGISHMLEHLLFNGTARRTQEQIYDEQDRYGIINNATTSTEHTAYFVMSARETSARALDLQADMLFGSIFPEEKLAKEREIIVNEIAKDRVQDEMVISDLYAARLYHPSSLGLPVIGTPETVRVIPRQAIVDYYRRWYAPNNMTAIIMGDFDEDEMRQIVTQCFGAAAPAPIATAPPLRVNPAAAGLTHASRTEGGARLLWLGAPAPGIESASYGPAHVLASLLGDGLQEAVNGRLKAGKASGSLLEISIGLDGHRGASTYQVRASLEPGLGWDDASAAILAELSGRLEQARWKTAALDGVRLEARAELMRLWEKPHYFGLDRAPYVAAAGWEVARDFARRLSWIEPPDVRDAARPIASPKAWALFEIGPDAPDDRGAVSASGGGFSAAAGTGPPTPESRALAERWKGPQSVEPPSLPEAAPAPGAAAARRPAPARVVLANGLTLILDATDDSRVFAAHVLVRERSAAEPPGKGGIVELLHRLAGTATLGRSSEDLQRALGAIGGTLKVADDASIPYDDIYLSPEYSYLRLEALDEFAPEALGLLREILFEPRLDDAAAIDSARDQILARVRQSKGSPRERCRLLLAGEIWGAGHPFSRPLFGSDESLRSITAEDLEAFHAAYFSPRNLVLAIGTSIRPERILPVIESKLGRWPSPPARAARPPAPAPPEPIGAERAEPAAEGGARLASETLKSSQAYLMMGRLAPEGPGAGALDALAAVLSRRMGDVLREKRGLSYSLGADAVRLAGRIQVTVSMGILPEKVEAARSGMREVLKSLVTSPPDQQEVDDAVRATEVRVRMRSLSRINRGWLRSLEEYRRQRSGAAGAVSAGETPPAVTADQVLSAARRILAEDSLEGWSEAVVAPTPPEAIR